MPAEVRFVEQVRDALHYLYDYAYLDHHPLAKRFWLQVGGIGPNRAQRLHRLLLETIEELHPPATLQ